MIVWKDIPEYEDFYQASDTGLIRSKDRIVSCRCNSTRIIKGRILKACMQNSGYMFVNLTKNKENKQFLVHRLVAITFIDNPLKLKEINHIDGDKTNNNVSNLEWCTPSYNKKHMYDNLLSGKLKKENLSKKLRGIKRTDETKRKVGDSHRGIKSVDAQPVMLLKTKECFGSIKELSRIKNIPFSNIQKDLKNNNFRFYKKITREDYYKYLESKESFLIGIRS